MDLAQPNLRNFNGLALIAWLIFFLSPLLWPHTHDSYLAMDLLALACGLLASAFMALSAPQLQERAYGSWAWLMLLITPIFIQLTFQDVRNPWRTWQMALYICSAWLIFRYARTVAKEFLGSTSWFVLIGCMGNFYVLFALLQNFNLYIIPGTDTFPIWQEIPSKFGGVLIQRNLEALLLAIACVSLWTRALTGPRYWPWLLASILPFAGLLATNSRSGIIVLTAGALILILLSRKYLGSTLKIAGPIGLGIVLLIYWQAALVTTTHHAADPTIVERLQTGDTHVRLIIWDMAVRMIWHHPWLGIGAGNFISYGTEAQAETLLHHPEWKAASNALLGGNAWAHNYLLQFFLEWGVFGGLAVLGLTSLILWKSLKLVTGSQRATLSTEAYVLLVLLMMLAHGLVSIALIQGYFLVLFALYAAALFPATGNTDSGSAQSLAIRLPMLLVPVVFTLWLWQNFIVIQTQADEAVGKPITSDGFIAPISRGIATPWTSRPSLEMYFANLAILHAKPSVWIGSENFAYRYWFEHQNSLSLRYLILIAHLKDDALTERRLISLYVKAYPDSAESRYLIHHADAGHAEGESLDLWK